MKKHLLHLSTLIMLVFATSLSFAQTQRYVDDVFSSVLKTSNVLYDSNRSVNILYGQVPGQLPIITVKLYCDIYTPPAIDTVAKRPVVIIAHTGSYLPTIINRQVTGSKDDSSIVEICKRFAQKGYVAVALDYRMGWNPQTTVQADAAEQLIKATYRAIQDVRNCIRYLRVNQDTYGIDTSMFIVGGQGTGGYVSLALATVDRRAEIESNPKFLRADFSPMVSVDTLGDWMGLGGVMLPSYPYYFNYTGDPAVSAVAHMAFHYGGAMGDLNWLEPTNLPLVCMQVVQDPFAPYMTGNVIVPTTGVTVIPNASGAGAVMPKANSIGVNNEINSSGFSDPYSMKAMQLSNNVKNLYPFYTKTVPDAAPWEWWDSASVNAITSVVINGIPIPASGHAADSISRLTNQDMSAAKGRAYCDTIVSFIAPRIAAQFNLAVFSGVKETASLTPSLKVYPVPAKSELTVQLPIAIKQITLTDVMGKDVTVINTNTTSYRMNLEGVKPGMYFLNVKSIDGRNAVKRVVVE